MNFEEINSQSFSVLFNEDDYEIDISINRKESESRRGPGMLKKAVSIRSLMMGKSQSEEETALLTDNSHGADSEMEDHQVVVTTTKQGESSSALADLIYGDDEAAYVSDLSDEEGNFDEPEAATDQATKDAKIAQRSFKRRSHRVGLARGGSSSRLLVADSRTNSEKSLVKDPGSHQRRRPGLTRDGSSSRLLADSCRSAGRGGLPRGGSSSRLLADCRSSSHRSLVSNPAQRRRQRSMQTRPQQGSRRSTGHRRTQSSRTPSKDTLQIIENALRGKPSQFVDAQNAEFEMPLKAPSPRRLKTSKSSSDIWETPGSLNEAVRRSRSACTMLGDLVPVAPKRLPSSRNLVASDGHRRGRKSTCSDKSNEEEDNRRQQWRSKSTERRLKGTKLLSPTPTRSTLSSSCSRNGGRLSQLS